MLKLNLSSQGTNSPKPSEDLRATSSSSSTSASTSPATALETHGIFAPASSSTTLLSTLVDTANQVIPRTGAYSIDNRGGAVTTVAHGSDACAVAANNTLADTVTTVHTSSAEVATKALKAVENNPSITQIIISNKDSSSSSSTSSNFNGIHPGPISTASGNSLSSGSTMIVAAISGNATFNIQGSISTSSSSSTSVTNDDKLQLLRMNLQKFYEQQAQISYLFYDVPAILISQAPRLAIVIEREQKDKELKQEQQPGALSHSRDIGSDLSTEDMSDPNPKNETKLIQDKRINSYEDIYGCKKPVELAKLFEKQDEKDKASNQIIIFGRAGIGKTALCQLIAYLRSQGKLWQDKYDWVFWIPLRNLSKQHYANKDKITLADVIYQECCSSQNDDDDSAINLADIQQLLKPKENKAKILLLLDGYDEIANIDKDDTAIGDLIKQLLSWEHVVLTSRPYAIPDSRQIQDYKRLENIGFLDEDIQDYVKKFFTTITHPTRADECLTFLKQNPLIWGTAHIPINLELICSAWNEKQEAGESLSGQLSMTELYEELVYKLGKRYLQKRSQNPVDTKALAKLSHEDTLEKCKPVMAFLGELAFEVSKPSDNRILIDKTVLGPLRKKHEKNNPTLFDDLLESHFLKSTGNQKNISDQSFYFVHLTFQEYFAAYHIVERLKQNDPSIIQFIREHKYVQSWEIVWWFVAGLLKNNSDDLEKFFYILEQEPIDLIGLYHQTLLIGCMNECQLKVAEARKKVFLENLRRWLNVEMKTICLKLSSCLSVLNDPGLVDSWVNSLNRAHEVNSKSCTLDVISSLNKSTALPKKILKTLVKSLFTDGHDSQSRAETALIAQTLPIDIFEELSTFLQDERSETKRKALTVIINKTKTSLPQCVLDALKKMMEDKNDLFVREAAELLCSQALLSRNIDDELRDLLHDNSELVKKTVLMNLRHQIQLPEDTLNVITELSKNKNENIRNAAVTVLANQAQLPPSIVSAVEKLLQDDDSDVRQAAACALKNQTQLPEDILNVIAELLKDKNENIRNAAVTVLANQAQLPPSIVSAVEKLLQDDDSDVRQAAACALKNQTQLSESILKVLMTMLEEKKCSRYVVRMLAEQSPLPPDILKKLGKLLRHKELFVVCAALEVLEYQTHLLPEIIKALEELLLDEEKNFTTELNYDVKMEVTLVLLKQTQAPPNAINALVALLRNTNTRFYPLSKVLNALYIHDTFPPEIVKIIVELLRNRDDDIQDSAENALTKHASLPFGIIEALGELLSDKDVSVRRKAENVLRQQSLTSIIKIINSLLFNATPIREFSLWTFVSAPFKPAPKKNHNRSLLAVLIMKSLKNTLPIYRDINLNKLIIGNKDLSIHFSNKNDLIDYVKQLNAVFHEFTNNHFMQKITIPAATSTSADDDNATLAADNHQPRGVSLGR